MTVINENVVTDIEEVMEAIASMSSTDLHLWISHRQGANTEISNLLELLKAHIEDSWKMGERMEELFTAAKKEKNLQQRKESGIRHADLLSVVLHSRLTLQTKKRELSEQADYLATWVCTFELAIKKYAQKLWDTQHKGLVDLTSESAALERNFNNAMKEMEEHPSDEAKMLWRKLLTVLGQISGWKSPFIGLKPLYDRCQTQAGEFLMR
ncbi:hypothetical protein [Shimazuella kribbensis]|uniref:hypothetical protein n=1 Tax=Shimazuella kribbensis TaxID=139808 RepID=UPI000413DA3F|nr:hypothetical protein [Shimazuella kribbensis]